jgi:hypothetical protein
MGLLDIFKPVWQSKNKEKALRAVERISDQQKLMEVAKTADLDYNVRRAAIDKLTDQSVLADIAKSDREQIIRRTTV